MCLRVSRVGYEGPSLPWGEGPVWVGLTPSVQDGRTAPSARRRPWAWRRRRSALHPSRPKGSSGSRRTGGFGDVSGQPLQPEKPRAVRRVCTLTEPRRRGFKSTGFVSMHFHANYVSTSVFGDGDYYQVMFEAEQDADDLDSPYLLIQRQFEDPDDDRC